MFLDCTSLVGGQGTTYDPDHVNKTYAHIDGGSSNPGYFTAAGAEPWHEPEAYACYTPSNTTLTFYCDTERSTREGTTYDLNVDMANPGWDDDNSYKSVTHVVFDPSFADARPTSTCSWFWGMTNLQTITGMDCMNTEDVTTMWGMFTTCSSLTTLDLSSFNTSRVTNMLSMFSDCSNLTTIYAGSGWSMATVSVTTNMFTNCTKLVGGQGTTYNPSYTNGYYARIDGGPSNPGYFTEKPLVQRGDVDGDGALDINDVTLLINVVLGQNQQTYYPAAADCDPENGDGVIDINDVTVLIGRILGGIW
jgi:surface protein